MSLIFMDGFEYAPLTGNAQMKWDAGGTYGLAPGRWGDIGPNGKSPYESTSCVMGPPLTFSTAWINGLTKTFPDKDCLTVGAAIFHTDLNDCLYPFIRWAKDLTPIVTLWVDPVTHHLQVRDGQGYADSSGNVPILANSTFVPPIGLWWYVEFKYDAKNAAVEVRAQGQTIIQASGLTINNATSTRKVNQLQISPLGHLTSTPVSFDDLYVIDDQGSTNVDFLGEIRVQTKFTSTLGSHSDWLPASGTNHMAMLNNQFGSPNDLSWPYYVPPTVWSETGKHVSGRYPGDWDSYHLKQFAITGQVFAIQTNLAVRKDDVGNRTVQATLHTTTIDPGGKQDFFGPDYGLFGEYTYTAYIWELDPSTQQFWTVAHLNAAEFGVRVPPVRGSAGDNMGVSISETAFKVVPTMMFGSDSVAIGLPETSLQS